MLLSSDMFGKMEQFFKKSLEKPTEVVKDFEVLEIENPIDFKEKMKALQKEGYFEKHQED